jgi:hypothetical protein
MPPVRKLSLSLSVFLGLLTVVPLVAEDITGTGHGTAPVAAVPKKQLPKATQQALSAAESAALTDAVTHAIYKLERRANLGADPEQILVETAQHSGDFVVNKEITRQSVDNGIATVDLTLTIDAGKLREYLDSVHDTAQTRKLDQRHVMVLTYTVEGMDPNRAEPAKLHEVIIAQDRYLHHREAEGNVDYNRDNAASVQGAEAQANSSRQAQRTDVVRADFLTGLRQRSAAAGSSASASRDDSAQAAAIDARMRDQEALHAAGRKELTTIATSDYIRVTDYADLTKKGAAQTNDVRALLEGIFHNAGLPTRFYNLKLMGLEFATEDDLSDAVLTSVVQDPNVDDNDYVAIAVNRLTPVNAAHEYTSVITYRVIKKGNGDELLPSKNVRGDSGVQPSDDYGKSVATEIAVNRAAAVLPGELKHAVDDLTRSAARDAGPVSTYSVRVDNVSSMAASDGLKQALRAAGFTVNDSYRGASRSETIIIQLNGRSPSEARAVVERNIAGFDVTSLDERSAILSHP